MPGKKCCLLTPKSVSEHLFRNFSFHSCHLRARQFVEAFYDFFSCFARSAKEELVYFIHEHLKAALVSTITTNLSVWCARIATRTLSPSFFPESTHRHHFCFVVPVSNLKIDFFYSSMSDAKSLFLCSYLKSRRKQWKIDYYRFYLRPLLIFWNFSYSFSVYFGQKEAT